MHQVLIPSIQTRRVHGRESFSLEHTGSHSLQRGRNLCVLRCWRILVACVCCSCGLVCMCCGKCVDVAGWHNDADAYKGAPRHVCLRIFIHSSKPLHSVLAGVHVHILSTWLHPPTLAILSATRKRRISLERGVLAFMNGLAGAGQ
jgi:hypothetical protein